MRPSSVSIVVALVLSAVAVHGAFYDKASGVVNLNAKTFDSTVKQDGQVFLVEFYAPWCGHCKALTPEWIKAAKSLAGVVGVGALDCDEEANKPLAGKYGIKGFPTIKLFIGKSDKPKDYMGERTAKAISEWALSQIPSNVKKVTDKTVAEFFKSSPKLPKALLFTKKASTAPMYKALSNKLKERMVLAEVHEKERKTLDQFGVSADDLPYLLAFPVKEAGADETDPSASGIRYSGKMNSRPLYAWLAQYALPGNDPEDAPVPELADQSCLQTLCVDESGLCAVAILGASEPADTKSYLSLWKQAAMSRDDSFFQFVWLNGTASAQHMEFLDKAFGLQAADYPQVVVLNAKKAKYTPFVGSFTVESIGEFLESVLRGRGAIPLNSATLPSLPSETKKCAPKPKAKEEPKPKPSSSGSAGAGGAGTGAGGEAGVNEVLTVKNFASKVLNSRQPWIVEFYAPWCGHCKNLAPEWSKASASLKNMVKFGMVDSTVEQALAQEYGIQGYPTIKVFPAGLTGAAKKKGVTDYQSARSSAALSQFALGLLSSKNVKTLSGGKDALARWALVTTNPAPARLLLFSNKPAVPHLLSALSVEFEGDVAFAFVKNTEQELVSLFNVTTFPSVFLLKTIADVSANIEAGPVPSNLLSFNQLSTVLTNFNGGRKAGAGAGAGAGASEPAKKAEEPVETGPVVTEPLSAADFDSQCVQKTGLCVIAVVNNAEESAEEVETFTKVATAQRAKRGAFRFLRVARDAQSDLVNAFDVPDAVAVSIVAVHPKKNRFVTYIGTFDVDAITNWLEGITKGTTKSYPFKALPKFRDVAKPAAGATKSKDEL